MGNQAKTIEQSNATSNSTRIPSRKLLVPGPGAVARELRPIQLEMAELIEASIGLSKHTLVEAGVGTGKTFAYTIPAVASRHRTIISTATLGLQAQLLGKDLPVLQDAFAGLGQNFTFAVAKGKSNYLCPVALRSAGKEGGLSVTKELKLWADRVEEGIEAADRDIGPEVSHSQWAQMNAESCMGKSCPHAESCSTLAAKGQAQSAQIVVANHAITALHVAFMTEAYDGLLGAANTLIIDEAHKASSFFRAAFSKTCRGTSVSRVAKGALELSIPGLDGVVADKWKTLALKFFRELPDPGSKPFLFLNSDLRNTRGALGAISALLDYKPFYQSLTTFHSEISKEVLDKHNHDYFHLYQRLSRLKASADAVRNAALDTWTALCDGDEKDEEAKETSNVVYVQKDTNGDKELHSAPLDIGGILRTRLYPRVNSVIFTSATLATAGNFTASQREFALPPGETVTKVLGSTFDYKSQSVLYIPKGLSEPAFGSNERYINDITNEIERLVRMSSGRALVLFTSRFDLSDVLKQLSPRLKDMLLLPQTEDHKPGPILADYLTACERGKSPVILGLKSFWEGVSLEGDLLTNVIITKIPFPPMSDPVYAAKCEASNNAFFEVTMPEMIKDIKQGAGRLIRTNKDYGVVSILDGRLHSKRYGATILKALPFEARSTDFGKVEAWFRKKAEKARG